MENTVALSLPIAGRLSTICDVQKFFSVADVGNGGWLTGPNYPIHFRRNHQDLIEYSLDRYITVGFGDIMKENEKNWVVRLQDFREVIHDFVGNSIIETHTSPGAENLSSFIIKLGCGSFAFNAGRVILRSQTFGDEYFEQFLRMDSIFRV